MLKTRVIPVLTIKDLRLVKSIRFGLYRNIGSYISAVKVFNARNVDEMIVLDIDASKNGLKPWLITQLTKECFMPLTIGGGIKTLKDIRTALKLGADKVTINTAAAQNPEFLNEASSRFGRQCIVASIDVKKVAERFEVYSNNGKRQTGKSVKEWAKEVEHRGAGEIFLTSIDRDGTMQGYDIELVKIVTRSVSIPVIASGGAGKLNHFVKVIKQGGASAVAAASIFQYTDITPNKVKDYLAKFNIGVRV